MMNSIHNIVQAYSLRLVLILFALYFSINISHGKNSYIAQPYCKSITELPSSSFENILNTSGLLWKESKIKLENLSAYIFAGQVPYSIHNLAATWPYAVQVESRSASRLNFFKIIPYAVIAVLLVALILLQKRKTKYEKDIQALLKQLDEHKKVKAKPKVKPSNKKEKFRKYRASTLKISKETLERIKNSLEEFEQNNLFLSSMVSASMLASYCQTNTRYVSDVVNRYKGQSITSYISNLRINYILSKLKKEERYRSLSLIHI